MFKHSNLPRAGFLETLRSLISWNKSNAAAQPHAASISEDSLAQPSHVEPARSKLAPAQTDARHGSGSTQTTRTNTFSRWSGRGGGRPAAATTPLDYRTLHVDSDGFDSESLLPALETVVLARRSTKIFDVARPVEKALIQRLLAASTRAPTANNLQAWHAIVVHEEDQKQQLCRAALGQRQIVTAPYTIVFAGDTEMELYAPQVLEQGLENGSISPGYGPFFLRSVYYHLHGGPCQSMALAKHVLSSWYSRQTSTPLLSVPVSKYGYAWKQTMIPATTFLHLATAAGLDSCVMEGIDEEAVKEVVGLPARFTVPVLISVGHAAPGDGAGGPRRPKTPRFAVSHTVRWGRYE